MNYMPYPYIMPDINNIPQMDNFQQELEGRISRLEREVRRLEQKINRLEHKQMKPLSSTPNNSINDNSSIYMV